MTKVPYSDFWTKEGREVELEIFLSQCSRRLCNALCYEYLWTVGSLKGSSIPWLSANYWVAFGTELSDCKWSRKLNMTQISFKGHSSVARTNRSVWNSSIVILKSVSTGEAVLMALKWGQRSSGLPHCETNRPAFSGCHKSGIQQQLLH